MEMQLSEQIEMLELLKSSLGSSQSFAEDLIRSYKKYGKLTPNQQPWVMKLLDRATKPDYHKQAVHVGNFAGVVALFETAKAHLKYPKITLKLGESPVILSLAGMNSKAPGTVNVMGAGQYPHRAWYGRITVGGEWEQSNEGLTGLAELLKELANDPAGVAAAHGKLTGNCCFCNSGLTDERSTAAGFGPVCAEHFGLKEQWKMAAEKVAA